MSKKGSLGLAIAMGLFWMGCGDGNNPTGNDRTQRMTRSIGEGSDSVPAGTFGMVPGEVLTRGDLELIVDWTFEDSTLWMYVTDGNCTQAQFQRDVCPFDAGCECTFLVKSETSDPKPRSLRLNNYLGSFRLIVWNIGNRNESISWQGLLTTTSTFRATFGPTESIRSDQSTLKAPVDRP